MLMLLCMLEENFYFIGKGNQRNEKEGKRSQSIHYCAVCDAHTQLYARLGSFLSHFDTRHDIAGSPTDA